MIISEEAKQRFLNMVCPEYRKLAEDLIDEKIDALYVVYGWHSYEWYPYGVKKCCCDSGQIFMKIYEDTLGHTPKIILFNLNVDLRSITDGDIELIRQVTRRYGDQMEYYFLINSDTDANLRWKIMKKYMNDSESCSVIMKKKCQKIYDSLSDSDKLLLELGEDLS